MTLNESKCTTRGPRVSERTKQKDGGGNVSRGGWSFHNEGRGFYTRTPRDYGIGVKPARLAQVRGVTVIGSREPNSSATLREFSRLAPRPRFTEADEPYDPMRSVRPLSVARTMIMGGAMLFIRPSIEPIDMKNPSLAWYTHRIPL